MIEGQGGNKIGTREVREDKKEKKEKGGEKDWRRHSGNRTIFGSPDVVVPGSCQRRKLKIVKGGITAVIFRLFRPFRCVLLRLSNRLPLLNVLAIMLLWRSPPRLVTSIRLLSSAAPAASPQAQYDELLAAGKIRPDSKQLQAVAGLESIHQSLERGLEQNHSNTWRPRGLYFHSPPGRGKTMLGEVERGAKDWRSVATSELPNAAICDKLKAASKASCIMR